MHACAIVLLRQEARPTEKDVEKAMEPWVEKFDEATDEMNGEWDWWQIGGRWTGAFVPSYDPAKDPANREPCGMCKGTGTRRDDIVLAHGGVREGYCNGCTGSGEPGVRVKWPTEWEPFDGDVVKTEEIPVEFDGSYAIVVEGRWLDRDHEKPFPDVRSWKGYWAVIVDYHN